MLKTFALAAATSTFAMTASAGVVDFSTLAPGTALTTFDFLNGVEGTASADGNNPNSPDVAVVFDTNNDGTSDQDLLSPFTLAGDSSVKRSFGNAIIIQENPGNDGVFDPDDDGRGGTLTFEFIETLAFGAFSLLDALKGTSVSLYDDGTLVSTLVTAIDADTGNDPDNNLFTILDFNGLQGDKFVVDFNGRSGALGEFEVSAVPLPASALLLLAGVGGLGIAGRRKS